MLYLHRDILSTHVVIVIFLKCLDTEEVPLLSNNLEQLSDSEKLDGNETSSSYLMPKFTFLNLLAVLRAEIPWGHIGPI